MGKNIIEVASLDDMETTCIMNIIDTDVMVVVQSVIIHATVMDNFGHRWALEKGRPQTSGSQSTPCLQSLSGNILRGITDRNNFYSAEPAQIYPFAVKCNALGSIIRVQSENAMNVEHEALSRGYIGRLDSRFGDFFSGTRWGLHWLVERTGQNEVLFAHSTQGNHGR